MHPLAIEKAALLLECLHRRRVLLQRHRSRSDVAVAFEVCTGALPTQVGQGVAVAGGTGAIGATHFDQFLAPEVLDQSLQQHVGQTELVTQHDAAQLARVQHLQRELLQLLIGKPGLLDGDRRRRHWRAAIDALDLLCRSFGCHVSLLRSFFSAA